MEMPIEIDIDNPSLFTHAAFIVDRPDVCKAVLKLRGKWLNDQLAKSVDDWKHEHRDEIYLFEADIINMLVKHNLSPTFASIIEQAVLANKVSHFPRVSRIVIPRKDVADLVQLSHETVGGMQYEYALVAPLESTEAEVIEAYRRMKQTVIKSRSRKITSDDPHELMQPTTDTLPTIKQQRDWYYRKLRGESYRQMAIVDNGGLDNYKKVTKAMKSFKKLDEKTGDDCLKYLKVLDDYIQSAKYGVREYRKRIKQAMLR
ncbi:hypothetical protein ACFL25_00430 [Patescibacteria group bacterium]